ncbi:MAG: alpha/beta fold hydrolase [Dermatophilaceae bacterium]|nr:alpha/beta hydrolase [Intrasporangiaceae bacterium]
MQRDAFEADRRLGDVEEIEIDPPARDGLAAVTVPTLVLTGAHDMDTIHAAADRVRRGVAGATLTEWSDTAHLPSMERPQDFSVLLEHWVTRLSR